MNAKYEKSDSPGTHKIEPDQVLTCAETGRVIAVFYNEHDLDEFLEVAKGSVVPIGDK